MTCTQMEAEFTILRGLFQLWDEDTDIQTQIFQISITTTVHMVLDLSTEILMDMVKMHTDTVWDQITIHQVTIIHTVHQRTIRTV